MYLSKLSIHNFRIFSNQTEIEFSKGLNLLVGENGCGKSATIDAIRALLNESDFSRKGISEEDFYVDYSNPISTSTDCIEIVGTFSNLNEDQKIEYLTWLTNTFDARLNLEIQHTTNTRNIYKQHRWGGMSSGSIFDWEPLNDIQCVYLPPLRDAEHALKSGRGSRLARLIANLSEDKLKETRNQSKKMQLEIQLEKFNSSAAQDDEIIRASQLINESLEKSAGAVYGQKTAIQFNQLTYERIIESLQILFFPKGNSAATVNLFRSLSENSLGYNTNSAEDEIRERTVSYLRHQIQYPHFLGTFTSWLHGYVANPFLSFVVKGRSSLSDAKLKIVDSSCRSEFLSAFKTKYTYGNLRHIPANHFFYNIKSQKYCYCGSNEIAEKKEFLEKCTQDIDCIKKDLRETKKRFRENGFCTYEHSSAEDLYRPICFDSTTWRSILMNIKNALVADADVLDLDQTWGEWKVKLSHALAAVNDDNVCELALGRLRNGVKRQKVITSFDQKIKAMQNCGIELETIHSCKGRGYDAILFVSSPRQNNTSASYWKNWFPRCEHGTTEATRLSYVAFSRAKQLLTLGIPNSTSSPLDNMDLKLLQSYGFKIYDCSTDAWLEE